MGDMEIGQTPHRVSQRDGEGVHAESHLAEGPRPTWSPWIWWLSRWCGWQGSMGTAPTSLWAPWCRDRSCPELLSLRLGLIPWAPMPVGGQGALLWGDMEGSTAGMCAPEITKGNRKSVCLKDFFEESSEAQLLRWSWLLEKSGTF